MGTQSGVGMSHNRNPKAAAQEAVKIALKAANVQQPDFVFMFASVGYNQQVLLNSVREATHHAPLIGCSGEGVIATGEADESNFSVAVMVIQSDEMRFEPGLAIGLKDDPTQVGSTIGADIHRQMQPDAKAMFLLADGLTFNFDRVMSGLEAQLKLDRSLPILGGVAADNSAFKQTYQYHNDQVISDGAVWALLSGDIRLAWAVNHGCVALGGKRQITRSAGNLIYEIDHKPVLEVLKEYLNEDEVENWQKAALNLCLGFKAPGYMQDYDEFLVRFITSKNDQTGAVAIQTEVVEGCDIWMTRRDHEKIEAGINQMAETIQNQLGQSSPKLVFQFDCCGRGKSVLREQEKLSLLKTLQQKVGAEAPWIGLYTLGEIGPVGDRNYFHNYTAVLTAVY